MTNRTQTADLLKGTAALLMIQVHILELFATDDIFKSSLGKILLFCGGPPVAPLFMIVFGYFIAGSKKSALELVIRGFKIIFLGLFLNLALNFNLIVSVYRGKFGVSIWPYIFGVDILPLAGLSLIIIALLSAIWRMNKSFVLYFLVGLAFISAFLGSFLLDYPTEQPYLKYIFSTFYGTSTWSYFPLFPWLSYPLAGIAFFKIKEKYDINLLTKPLVKIIFGLLFLLFLTLTIQYAVNTSSDLQMYYHHGLIFFLWVIVFLSFYSFFINEIEKISGTFFLIGYFKWVGKNITFIYVIQWIIIGNIATMIYKTISSPLYLLISFIAVLFVSSCICYLWIKFKEKSLKPIKN